MKNCCLRSSCWVASVLLVAALQAACTQTPAAPLQSAVEMRLLVKAGVNTDGLAADDLAQRAAQIAKLPVRYLTASGAGWHALVLGCAELGQCNLGLQRLKSQPSEFTSVEPDARASLGPGAQPPAMSR